MKKMFEFKMVKMVWRSCLMFVLYWALLFTIICIIAIAAILGLFVAHPEYLG